MCGCLRCLARETRGDRVIRLQVWVRRGEGTVAERSASIFKDTTCTTARDACVSSQFTCGADPLNQRYSSDGQLQAKTQTGCPLSLVFLHWISASAYLFQLQLDCRVAARMSVPSSGWTKRRRMRQQLVQQWEAVEAMAQKRLATDEPRQGIAGLARGSS